MPLDATAEYAIAGSWFATWNAAANHRATRQEACSKRARFASNQANRWSLL